MSNPVLLTLAAGGEHPLIDIDFTMGVQFAIFVVAFFVASKFLFRPYLKMRDARAAGIDGARVEAGKMDAEADARLADYEGKLDQARTKALDERRKLRAEAAATQARVTDSARTAAARSFEHAKEKADAELEAARKQLLPQADALATEIVSKLLGREVA